MLRGDGGKFLADPAVNYVATIPGRINVVFLRISHELQKIIEKLQGSCPKGD
jgi:hypothetical protein